MSAQIPIPGCPYHQGMGFVYVCKMCDNELVCIDCVLDRHYQHNLRKLTDYVLEQKSQIEQYQKKLSEHDLPKLECDIRENDERFEKCCEQIRKMIDEIKIQGKKMKNEIDNSIERVVTICRDLEKLNDDITKKNNAALVKYLKEEIRPKLDRCQRALSSDVTVDVITVANQVKSSSTAPPTVGGLKTAAFKSGTLSSGILDRMLGSLLIDGDNPEFRPVQKTSVVSSFRSDVVYTSCRTSCTGDKAWLSHWKGNKIYQVDKKGAIQDLIDCKVEVQTITVSPTTGRVWFCVLEDKSIQECMSDGSTVTRFKVDSCPFSLCFTNEDMIVVGMVNEIVLYTIDGRRVTDGAGRVCRQQAVSPHRITCCRLSGDVAALDTDDILFSQYMTSKEPGSQPRVIIMDKHMKYKFRYHAIDAMQPQTNDTQENKFFPQDVCYDGAGDILVLDIASKTVILIDGNNGHFLRTLYISEGSKPTSMSLQGDSTLWVGHGSREMKIIKFIR
ncbi:uncharacterized protein LOC132562351 [Ylistrum balloti]|uniref:uncharacterized protein LOC132562351 n=1 Tax=Ylistrum balloti TaxID=509963 RepID=UPI002905EB35|nr:uncharacterized protein LOC132562351 [Ylistrum balloti]